MLKTTPQNGISCAQCGKPAMMRCSQCKKTRYCGRSCQRKHWKDGHKQACLSYISTGTIDIKDNLKNLSRSDNTGIFSTAMIYSNSSQETSHIQQSYVSTSEAMTEDVHSTNGENFGVCMVESDSSMGTLNLNESSISESDSALTVEDESSSDSLHLDSDVSVDDIFCTVNSKSNHIDLSNDETKSFKIEQSKGCKSLDNSGCVNLHLESCKRQHTKDLETLETADYNSLNTTSYLIQQSDGHKNLQTKNFASLKTKEFKVHDSDSDYSDSEDFPGVLPEIGKRYTKPSAITVGLSSSRLGKHMSSNSVKAVHISSHSSPETVKSYTDSGFEMEKETSLSEEVSQLMSIFPDADESLVSIQLKIEKLSHPDNYLDSICNMLIENPQTFTETTAKNAHISKKIFPSTNLHKKSFSTGATTIESVKNSQRYVNVLSAQAEEEKANTRRRHCDDDLFSEHSSPKKLRLENEMQVDSTVIVTSERKSPNDFDEAVTHPIKPNNTVSCNDPTSSQFQCNSCMSYKECDHLTQCCEGHVLCQQCIEPQVKDILASDKKAEIKCPVGLCESMVPVGEAKKILPSIVIDLLQTKLDKESLDTINNMPDIFKCPDCGLAVAMDPENKEFQCQNEDCMMTCCRYCKKNWNDGDHANCNSLLSADDLSSMDQFPLHWNPMPDNDMDFISVELLPGSQEYYTVIRRYSDTMPHHSVKSIKRIQNPRLWQKYLLTRKHMLDDIGAQKLNEQLLFHGANPQIVNAICKEGFDWRVCGQHGTAFGQGTYFAKDARYSAQYCNSLASRTHRDQTVAVNAFPLPPTQGPNPTNAFPLPPTQAPLPAALGPGMVITFGNQQWYPSTAPLPSSTVKPHGKSKFILCARVLCGRMTQGHNKMRRPPPDPADSKQRPFNSAVNDMIHPAIFVIFESSQTYPEYVLEFL